MRGLGLRVDPKQHDRVGVQTEVFATHGDRIVVGDPLGTVGTDDEVVLGAGLVLLGLEDMTELDARQLIEAVVEVAEAAGDREAGHDQHHVEADQEALRPGPTGPRPGAGP